MNTRMTGTFGRPGALVAIALVAVVASCIETDAVDGPVGAVDVTLTIDADNVPTLDYEVSGLGMASMRGQVASARPGAMASVSLTGVPAGRLASIAVTGRSSDGATNCQGRALLEATPGRQSQLGLALLCRTASPNASTHGERLRSCPVIESYSASSFVATPGVPITLQATAADADAEDELRFSWSAPAGRFSSPGQPYTRYECAEPGDRVLTLSVTDGWCTYIAGFSVSCKPTPERVGTTLSWR
jgi:hypothetical protein